MIVQHLNGGRALVDRAALRCETGLSEVTIRMRLRAAAYDPGTGRALYDHDTARAALAGVIACPQRQGRSPRRTRRWARRVLA
jgi:hypothetical protein